MANITNTDWLNELELSVEESREVDRGINALVRSALLRTHEEMYHEPIKIRPFYRYFKPWIGRTSFYNLLEGRGGVSPERAVGLLASDRELREAVGLDPNNITEEEWHVVHKLTRRNLASASLLGWLRTTKSFDTSIAHLQASGTTFSEPNSFASFQKPLM